MYDPADHNPPTDPADLRDVTPDSPVDQRPTPAIEQEWHEFGHWLVTTFQPEKVDDAAVLHPGGKYESGPEFCRRALQLALDRGAFAPTNATAYIQGLTAELEALAPDHPLFDQYPLRSPEQSLVRKLKHAIDEAKVKLKHADESKARRDDHDAWQRYLWARIVPESVPAKDEALVGRKFKLVEVNSVTDRESAWSKFCEAAAGVGLNASRNVETGEITTWPAAKPV